ncbi:hypothetical protein BH708_02405 [Brachybacterium sp. P6-10-X1]|nr:hypothetical protein BH708_02405 [Brachybacterium sp. P6-10-X1]
MISCLEHQSRVSRLLVEAFGSDEIIDVRQRRYLSEPLGPDVRLCGPCSVEAAARLTVVSLQRACGTRATGSRW